MNVDTAVPRVGSRFGLLLVLGAVVVVSRANVSASSTERSSTIVSQSPGEVRRFQKISDTEGGFDGVLDDGDNFGLAQAMVSDLDGDGVPDLAVSAARDDDGGIDRGAVWLLFLSAEGTVNTHQKISDTEGGFDGVLDNVDNFGTAQAMVGDLDGDGVPDTAVGAGGDDDGGINRGAVWILFLNTDGTVNSHQKISDTEGGFGGTLDDRDIFGVSVAPLGDLDDDGAADLAVGAWRDDDGGPDRGAVWILFLNPDGTVKSHQKISATDGGFEGTLDDGVGFGLSLAALGDLDGDGVQDIAVGAREDDDGGARRGAAWILFLRTDGTVRANQKISDTEGGFDGTLGNGDFFGSSLAALGDLDGDGVQDLAVGADADNEGGVDDGAVWILFLNTDGTVKGHQKISATEGGFDGTLDEGDRFGHAAALGDMDGDGVPDIVVGAGGDDDGGTNRGAVWILFLDGVAGPTFDNPREFPAAGEALLHDIGNLDTSPAASGPDEPTEDVVTVIPGEDAEMTGLVQVFLNQGTDESGAWLGLIDNLAIDTGREPSGVAVGLLNADLFLDLAVCNAGDDNVFVYFNDGSGQGTLLDPVIVPVGDEPRAIAAGDFDEDGDIDLAVANAADQTIVVLANDGAGNFEVLLTIPGGNGMGRLLPDDLDGDKDLDLGHANSGDGALGVVFLEGGEIESQLTLPVGLLPVDMISGDFDGNGFRDLASANNGDATVSVLLNDGNGVFQPAVRLLVGNAPKSVDAADLDGDLRPDLVVVAEDVLIGPAVLVLENQTEGGELVFGPPVAFGVDADPNFVATADLNNDLLTDVVTSNTDDGPTGGSVSVLLNAPAQTPCVGDIDGTGDVGFSDVLRILSAWGPYEPCPPYVAEDLDQNCDVGFSDVLVVLSGWGPCS